MLVFCLDETDNTGALVVCGADDGSDDVDASDSRDDVLDGSGIGLVGFGMGGRMCDDWGFDGGCRGLDCCKGTAGVNRDSIVAGNCLDLDCCRTSAGTKRGSILAGGC